MFQYLVLLGAAVQLVGIASYIKDTLNGTTKPNRVSWLLWSIAPLIATAASLVDGVTWAVLPVFVAGFGPLLVLISSFFNSKAYWKLERFDYLCGLFSIMALVLWAITKEASIAVLFSIISDFFAAVPTLIKSWRYPETETAAPFTTGIFSALTSFVAIHAWIFAAYAFPAYLVLIDIALVFAIYRKRLIPQPRN